MIPCVEAVKRPRSHCLDRTFAHSLIDEASLAPRDGYKRGDKHMARIRAQI
jgi:hypothetical protein